MGTVFLRDLTLRTVIGVSEEERLAPRDVLLSLDLETELVPAAASDELSDSIDYAAVAALVVDHAASARFRLLEALAGSIAALVLDRFPRVTGVTVRVEKPAAVPRARSVGVEFRRER